MVPHARDKQSACNHRSNPYEFVWSFVTRDFTLHCDLCDEVLPSDTTHVNLLLVRDVFLLCHFMLSVVALTIWYLGEWLPDPRNPDPAPLGLLLFSVCAYAVVFGMGVIAWKQLPPVSAPECGHKPSLIDSIRCFVRGDGLIGCAICGSELPACVSALMIKKSYQDFVYLAKIAIVGVLLVLLLGWRVALTAFIVLTLAYGPVVAASAAFYHRFGRMARRESQCPD